jgi:hypothetical protein
MDWSARWQRRRQTPFSPLLALAEYSVQADAAGLEKNTQFRPARFEYMMESDDMTRMFRFGAILLIMALPLMSAGTAQSQGRFWLVSGELIRKGIRSCGGDIARFCGRTVPGQGRIMQCLADSYDNVSAPCQGFMDRLFSIRDLQLACAADAERLCPDVVPGGGRIAGCLIAKEDNVSKQCRKALSSMMGTTNPAVK